MRGAAIYETGGLECLRVAELPPPEARAGEVVIDVRAAALNHLDIWVRKGRPGHTYQFPHILGSDAAGVIVELGPGVTNLREGDEVVLNPGVSCGRCAWCLAGQQSECPDFGIVGLSRPGAFAQRVAVPACNVYPRPKALSWEESAALPLAYLTAWRMVFSRGGLQAGESVLIHGIGGGVALAALQLVKLAGGRAIVTSSSEEKLARAKALGADALIHHPSIPVAEAVRESTGGRGADVIIDTTGGATWPINFEAARKGGRIVHCGVTTGPQASVNIAQLYWKQLSVLGSTMGSQEEFRRLLSAVESAALRPVIDSVFPLAEAREAQGRMEQAAQFGKIVLAL